MNWALFRRKDKSIDIVEAFSWQVSILFDYDPPGYGLALHYLSDVNRQESIVSGQVAASVIATALHIARTS